VAPARLAGRRAVSRRLILASTSTWRGRLLKQLQLPFEQRDPGVDEAPFKDRGLAAPDLVVELAKAKAAAVADGSPDALVIGADQVVALDGRILGKPGTRERAIEQLTLLAGRTHQLVGGIALHDTGSGEVRTALDVHSVTVRPLTRAAIERYVDAEDVTGCAGSYRIEGLGVSLFEQIEGSDYTGVIGLPLMVVTRLLTAAGLDPLAP